MQALILAGGLGERLRPLTDTTPKPLLPIKGIPIIGHILKRLANYKVEKANLSIGYKAEEIQKYFKEFYELPINYCIEKEPLGTGGAIKLSAKDFKERFLLIWGDNLSDVNYRALEEVHVKNNAILTMTLTPREDVEHFGVAKLDGLRVLGFVEKPKREEAPSNLINAGVMLVEPELILKIPDGKSSIERDCFENLVKEGRVFSYIHSGQWFPTDTLEKYKVAEKNWHQQIQKV